MAFLVHPLPDILLAYIEGSRDMAHQIGDQKTVGLVSGAPFRWVQVANHLAAFVGKHDDQRVLDPEGPGLGNLRPGNSAKAISASVRPGWTPRENSSGTFTYTRRVSVWAM